ncbi:RNA-dependent RNA polymerase, partial [viral metagenome]
GAVSRLVLAEWRHAMAPGLCDEHDYRALGLTTYEFDASTSSRDRPWQRLNSRAGRSRFVSLGRKACNEWAHTVGAGVDTQESNLARLQLYDVLRSTSKMRGPVHRALDHLFSGLGPTNWVHATALATYCALTPGAEAVMRWGRQSRALAMERHACVRVWKGATQHVMRTLCTPDGVAVTPKAARSWLYLHMLVGRSGMVSDWEAERDARAAPHYSKVNVRPDDVTVSDTETYWADFEDALNDVFARAFVRRPQVNDTVQDWWNKRYTWVARGSARVYHHYQLPDDIKQRMHKGTLFECLPGNWLERVLSTAPHQCAGEAEKYENGSNRALYSVLSTHYAVTSYVLTQMEDAVRASEISDLGLGGAAEASAQLKRMDALAAAKRRGHEAFMYDYSNMNGQESPWEQATVFRCALNAMHRAGLCGRGAADYTRATKWVIESFDNMYLASDGMRTLHGLYSGMRGTSWVNTFVNYAWMQCARRAVQRTEKYDPLVHAVHNGDDVFAVTRHHAAT